MSLKFLWLIFLLLNFRESHAEPEKTVEVFAVVRGDIYQSVRLIGTVRAKKQAVQSAKISGHLDIRIPAGEFVKKDTLFAEIENSDLQRKYDLLANAAEIAKTQYERIQTLQKNNSASQLTLEEKKIAWQEAESKALDAKAGLDKTKLTAPFDGVLGGYKVPEGAFLKEGDTIVTLYQNDHLVVEIEIPEGILSSLSENAKVLINGTSLPLLHFQKIVDAETHMASALTDLSSLNSKDFIIGSAVDVELIVQEKTGTTIIPHESIFIKDGQLHVYVFEENKATLKPIKIGVRQKEKVEVTEGLKEGEQVIIRGQDNLYDGIEVKVGPSVLLSGKTKKTS